MKFTADAKELYNAIAACSKICSKDDSRQTLRHIEMCCTGSNLIITALDGFAMIQKHVQIEGHEDGYCVVRPEMMLNALRGQRGIVRGSVDDGRISMHFDNAMSISIKVFDGQFIQHADLWPSEETRPTTSIFVNAEYLVKVVNGLKCKEKRNLIELQVPIDPLKVMTVRAHGAEDRGLVLPVRVTRHDRDTQEQERKAE